MAEKYHISEQDESFIRMACEIARENIDNGGGPFGAVIVKDGEVISTGGSTVTLTNDPTAHAVVNAIRNACRLTRNFKLDGCVVYSSCEPCPMCMSALCWAGVRRVYFANTQDETRDMNCDDNFICLELEKPHLERNIPFIHVEEPAAIGQSKK